MVKHSGSHWTAAGFMYCPALTGRFFTLYHNDGACDEQNSAGKQTQEEQIGLGVHRAVDHAVHLTEGAAPKIVHTGVTADGIENRLFFAGG